MTTLKCRFGHTFTTSAKPGGTTGCPDCRREGRRTSVRVPAGTGTARAAGPARAAPEDDGDTARLAAAWAAEAPAELHWRRTPTQPAEGEECDECDGPLVWHSARTALYCPACDRPTISAGVAERAEAHRGALVRHRQGAEIIPVDHAAEDRARQARIDLGRNRDMLSDYLNRALEWCEVDYEYQQDARLAAELGATLRQYPHEISGAPDTATLLRILGELQAIRGGGEFKALIAAYRQQRERQDRAAEVAERRAIEQARAEEAERAAIEQARAEAIEQRRRAELAAQERRQLPAAPRTPPVNGTTLAIMGVYELAEHFRAASAAKQQAIAANGACAWCRKPTPATRVYGVGVADTWGRTTVLSPNHETRKACAKHQSDADAWLAQAHPGRAVFYWELTE